ncbi:MAG: LPS assembly lipoprotein LptE [Rhodobacteraceae bacterium]|nr:LPS assembly lipoprotein LptE [Paracoccaceae bacterium]
MSWYSRRLLLAAPLAMALAGCGFTPVYAPGGNGAALLGRVIVDPPSDREGYLLVQDLEQRLGRGTAPVYSLSVDLGIEEEPLAITAAGDITRYNLIGSAAYTLRELESQRVAAAGEVSGFTGYSDTGSTVETLAAERDARRRLMTMLADQITARLFATADLADE